MEEGSLLELGTVTRLHGIKGSLFLFLFAKTEQEITRVITHQTVYFKKNSEWILQSIISKASLHKEGLILSVEKVDKLSCAEVLKGSRVFVQENLFVSKTGENFYLCEIKGFKVCDKKRGVLGLIHSFSYNGFQDLVIVQTVKDKQIEVPLVQPLVIDINFSLRKILVDLPLGWPGLEQ